MSDLIDFFPKTLQLLIDSGDFWKQKNLQKFFLKNHFFHVAQIFQKFYKSSKYFFEASFFIIVFISFSSFWQMIFQKKTFLETLLKRRILHDFITHKWLFIGQIKQNKIFLSFQIFFSVQKREMKIPTTGDLPKK